MKGFSLLEIMVTVAIIAIMSATVVVGFGSFEKTVRIKETAAVVTDIIKNLELDMIRREYSQQTIHFKQDYLVSEAQAEAQTLSLKWNGQGTCPLGQEELEATGAVTPIYLAKRDEEGNNLEISVVSGLVPKKSCISFSDAPEREWRYQLFSGAEVSQTIRFIHFNLRRDDDKEQRAKITDGTDYTLKITAPYADKEFYENDALTTKIVQLTIASDDGERQEPVILQEQIL